MKRLRPWVRLALAAVLVLAFFARGLHTRMGLPYLHHWDEPAIGHKALDILRTGDYNPHFFQYPSLLIYLHAGVDVLHYFHLVSQPEDEAGALASLAEIETGPANDPWFVSHPSFYQWNRTLTALFGTVAIALVFFLARRLWFAWSTGDATEARAGPAADLAGLLAAGALATLAFHIRHSAFLTTDAPAVTLALAAVFLSVRFAQDRRPRDLALAALLAGFAASTKYNLGTTALVPFVALLGVWASRLRTRSPEESPAGYHPVLWAAVLGLPTVGFLAGTPYALLDLRAFLDDAGYEIHHYLVQGHPPWTVEPGGPHLVADLGLLVTYAGWPLLLPALVGLAVALRRKAGWLALLLPVLQLFLTARTSVLFHRNLLILYPFVAVAFGLGVLAAMQGLDRLLRTRKLRWRLAARVLAWGLVAWMLGARAVHEIAIGWQSWAVAETRSQAVDEVNRRVAEAGEPSGPPLELEIAAELELHPLDLERLAVPYRIRPLAEIACRPEPRTRVLVPQRVSTRLPSLEVESERLDGLLARGGGEIATVGDRVTQLSLFSTDPAVVLRRPWPTDDGGRPLPGCPP